MTDTAREFPPNLVIGDVDGGRIADNVMHFVRLLRSVGFQAGPAATVEAADALGLVGVGSRTDVYWTLHALLVEREDQRPLFRQAFRLFWRNIDPAVADLPLLSTDGSRRMPDSKRQVSRRVDEAWQGQESRCKSKPTELEMDHTGTASGTDVETSRDFEQMSHEEWMQARRLVRNIAVAVKPRRTRRWIRSSRGQVDVRATVRRSMRTGGEPLELLRHAQDARLPPLVVLCDVSGSMSSYSRMFLHFMHALGLSGTHVHRFVFGTRLTNIDRCLRHGDPDIGVEQTSRMVRDWSGGTRIGETLREFNVRWARRTLTQGAVVLFATDGLERGGDGALKTLAFETERLSKSCRRLVWLNPLMRYSSYKALAGGAQIIARHADQMYSIHNVNSLAEFAEALAKGGRRGRIIH